MPEAPIVAVKTGDFNRVPVIEGTNHDEMTFFTPTSFNSLDLSVPSEDALYNLYISFVAGPSAVAAINAEYPPSSYLSPFYSYAAATTDYYWACPAYFADQAMSRRTPTNSTIRTSRRSRLHR